MKSAGNLHKDGGETLYKRNVFPPKDAKNIVDGTWEQRRRLRQIGTITKLIVNIKKRYLMILVRIMSRESYKSLIFTRQTKGNGDIGK